MRWGGGWQHNVEVPHRSRFPSNRGTHVAACLQHEAPLTLSHHEGSEQMKALAGTSAFPKPSVLRFQIPLAHASLVL